MLLARGERDHLVGRKLPLGQDVEHFPAHIAGGADDCDLVTHDSLRRLSNLRAAGPVGGRFTPKTLPNSTP